MHEVGREQRLVVHGLSEPRITFVGKDRLSLAMLFS